LLCTNYHYVRVVVCQSVILGGVCGQMHALAAVFLLSGAAAFAPSHPRLPLQRHALSLDRPLARKAPYSTRVAASARISQRGLVVRHAAAAAKAEAASLDTAAIVKYAVAIATQVIHARNCNKRTL
jgi:hypothetical protein